MEHTDILELIAVDCRLALALEGSRGRVQHLEAVPGPSI